MQFNIAKCQLLSMSNKKNTRKFDCTLDSQYLTPTDEHDYLQCNRHKIEAIQCLSKERKNFQRILAGASMITENPSEICYCLLRSRQKPQYFKNKLPAITHAVSDKSRFRFGSVQFLSFFHSFLWGGGGGGAAIV